MAIDIKTQSLFPVRRDKQIASSITYGKGSGGGGGVIDASIDLSNYALISYVDSSLLARDLNISYLESSINNSYDAAMFFIPEVSLNDSYFKWIGGYLEPSIASGGTGDVTKLYVDGSLAVRDGRIAAINASLGDEDNILSYVNSSTYYDGSLNLRLLKSGDTMTGTLVVDTCIGIGKNPTYKLDVNGDINMPASSYFRLNTNPAIQQNGGYMTFGWLSSVYHYFRTSTSTPYLALIKGNAVALGIDGNSNTDLYNHRVVNLATPTDASDATNRYYVDASLNAKANKNASISYKTSAYTLSSNDNNCVIEASGTFGIYLPTNVDTGFQALIMNVGGGTITINASTGATVYTRDSSNDLTKRWTGATVYKRDSTSWAAMGDFSSKTSSVSATPTIYYKMDDTSGNIKDALGIYDSSSTDSLSYSQSGKINTAIGFDQDAGGATIPVENSIFDFSSDSSLSVSFWVKPKTNWDIDYTGRLYLGSVYSDYGLTLAHNTTGNVTFRWRDPNNKKHSLVRDISLGTYYYLTFTKLGTELKFYVDASLAFTSSESTYSSYSPATWNLGQGIMADIDEFALFLGTALTPKDVSALYNNGNGLSYPY